MQLENSGETQKVFVSDIERLKEQLEAAQKKVAKLKQVKLAQTKAKEQQTDMQSI